MTWTKLIWITSGVFVNVSPTVSQPIGCQRGLWLVSTRSVKQTKGLEKLQLQCCFSYLNILLHLLRSCWTKAWLIRIVILKWIDLFKFKLRLRHAGGSIPRQDKEWDVDLELFSTKNKEFFAALSRHPLSRTQYIIHPLLWSVELLLIDKSSIDWKGP